jgi:alpha-tubulin suppressor-like RCC1 family protein
VPLTGEKVDPAVMNDESRYQMNATAVITTLGNVYTAGDNRYGKLGTGGPLQTCNATFAKVQLPAGVKAKALANADEYTMFILGDNGKVYAVGRNNNGQLGDGTTTNRSTPVEVKVPRQETVY